MSKATRSKQQNNSTEKTKVTPVLVLEWLDRRPSGYEKEGSREEGQPIFLDSASQQFVLPRSVVKEEDGSLKPIRYIRNAKTIFQDEQDKLGIKPNPMTDFIVFEHGVLTVRREGADIALYEYLKHCSFNKDAAARSEGVAAQFYEINTEVEAEEEMELFDDIVDSFTLLKELRSKSKGGQMEYNEERIAALVSLFNIVNVDTNAEKFAALVSLATSRPSYYKKMVDDSTVSVKVAVAQGRELGVISLDGDGASFVESGRVFMKFNSKSADERANELVNHFMATAGHKDFGELNVRIEAAKALRLQSL